jgi:hypothetical protein
MHVGLFFLLPGSTQYFNGNLPLIFSKCSYLVKAPSRRFLTIDEIMLVSSHNFYFLSDAFTTNIGRGSHVTDVVEERKKICHEIFSFPLK